MKTPQVILTSILIGSIGMNLSQGLTISSLTEENYILSKDNIKSKEMIQGLSQTTTELRSQLSDVRTRPQRSETTTVCVRPSPTTMMDHIVSSSLSSLYGC